MKWLKSLFFLGVALPLACQNNEKVAELAAKEQQLAAREQQLNEDTLATREQAVALREQAAARATAAATIAPAAPPEASSAPSTTATVQPTRTVATAPEAETVQPAPLVPRPVVLTATVSVDMVKPDGQQWDGLGDAPDPLITATVQRSGQSATSLTKNALNATASLQLNLQVGDTISISVVDKDLSAHDPIGSFSAMYFGGPVPQQGKLGAGSISVNFSWPMTD